MEKKVFCNFQAVMTGPLGLTTGCIDKCLSEEAATLAGAELTLVLHA